jgi:hypothetical protein
MPDRERLLRAADAMKVAKNLFAKIILEKIRRIVQKQTSSACGEIRVGIWGDRPCFGRGARWPY